MALTVAALLWKQYADREARRSAIRTEIRRYERAQNAIDRDAKNAGVALDDYLSWVDRANEFSKKRHDGAVSGGQSTETNLSLAKNEQSAVSHAESEIDRLESGINSVAVTFASVLGDDAVRDYRSDARSLTTNMRLNLTSWDRAVSDIVDADKIELRGSYDSSSSSGDIERLYQSSDEAQARFQGLLNAFGVDVKQLRSRLKSRIADAKARLAKI